MAEMGGDIVLPKLMKYLTEARLTLDLKLERFDGMVYVCLAYNNVRRAQRISI